jgi:hypothetical protein
MEQNRLVSLAQEVDEYRQSKKYRDCIKGEESKILFRVGLRVRGHFQVSQRHNLLIACAKLNILQMGPAAAPGQEVSATKFGNGLETSSAYDPWCRSRLLRPKVFRKRS